MNQKQRIINTINHIQCDPVPYQLDLTHDMEQKIIDKLGADFLDTVDNCFAVERNEEFIDIDPHRKKDMFGAVWLMDQQGDFGVVENPQLSEPDLSGYTFPKPDEAKIREKCERLVNGKNKDKFSMYIIGFSLYERAWSLRGVENALMDMALYPEFFTELLDNIVEYNNAVASIAMEYPIDAIFYGDDWGQQRGLIMGPQYWREFIKPALKKMYSHVKDNGRYLCQHSCGDIVDVFPDLIELGLDIYNTYQPEIYDVPAVKAKYGDKLSFYGGVSTQNVLPFGTPEEVKEQTKMMLDVMGKDGGYICAPTHSMPADISIENLQAFLEVVQNQ